MAEPCARAREWLESLGSKDLNSDPALNCLNDPAIRTKYEGFVMRGLQVQHLQIGRVICTFRVPPRLTDELGRWPAGALMSMVDDVCAAAIMTCDEPIKVSVDYNLTYIRPAKAHEEIEIEARVLGHRGGLSTVVADMREKKTGETIAQARQSMHSYPGSKPLSKL